MMGIVQAPRTRYKSSKLLGSAELSALPAFFRFLNRKALKRLAASFHTPAMARGGRRRRIGEQQLSNNQRCCLPPLLRLPANS
jgi:hypothetical protein